MGAAMHEPEPGTAIRSQIPPCSWNQLPADNRRLGSESGVVQRLGPPPISWLRRSWCGFHGVEKKENEETWSRRGTRLSADAYSFLGYYQGVRPQAILRNG